MNNRGGNYYYITDGCSKTGNYKVCVVINGLKDLIGEVKNNKFRGLMEARSIIYGHMKKYNYPDDKIVPHYCIKPGREESKNVWEDWEVWKYRDLSEKYEEQYRNH